MAKTNKKDIFKKIISSIWFWLGLGLLLRLGIVYFQYSGDVRNHIAWADAFLAQSKGFFDRSIPGFAQPNYPPITIYLFALFRSFYFLINSSVTWLNQLIPIFPSSLVPVFSTLNMQTAFLKLPAIFADLGITYLIYKTLKTKKNLIKILIPILFLFNPATIYISTVWGQVESIPLFFLTLSLYFVFVSPHYYTSHLSFLLAALSKQTALWLLPVYVIIWIKKESLPKFFEVLILDILVFWAFYLPFAQKTFKPFSIYLSTLSGSSNVVADAAWNIFYPLGGNLPDSTTIGFISIRVLSLALLAISFFLVLRFLWKNYSFKNAVLSLFLLSLFAFFFQTRVHERHLFPTLLWLTLLLSFNPKWFWALLVLSAFHLQNLIFSLGLPFI